MFSVWLNHRFVRTFEDQDTAVHYAEVLALRGAPRDNVEVREGQRIVHWIQNG